MYTDAVIKNCFKTKFSTIEFIIHSMSWRNAWRNKPQRPKTCCVFSFALVPYLGPLIRCFCTLYEKNLLHMTVNNLKYSLNLLLEHAEFKFQALAITLFIQTEMHIHMHAHTMIMSKSMLVVQRTFFLHKCDFPSKTCPSSISQNWKYLKAAWRGSILWSVKLLSSGFDWTLCFWGLRHIIRHELC